MSVMPRQLFVGAVVAALLATAMPAAPAERELSDSDVTAAVGTEIWIDAVVDADAIEVSTARGVVTLVGRVNDLLAKERAERIAEGVAGVRAVVNRIEVDPPLPPLGPNDDEIRRNIEAAWLADPAADAYEIKAAVDNGVATLTGTVSSWAERELSATVAKGVTGVKAIENEIEVSYDAKRSDGEIKREIQERMANDVRVDDYLIEVEVSNGRVALKGTVGSLKEKLQAKRDARVRGVKSVEDKGLRVEWWARDRLRRRDVSRSDEEITAAVQDAFLYDPRVMAFNPLVEVSNGTVTLRGVVTDLPAKQAAGEDARNVVGVWRVINHLKVRPETTPSKQELEKRVVERLEKDPYVDRLRISVDTTDYGWVYLSGKLNNSFEKRRAEALVEGIKGVVRVISTLDYEYAWTWKPDREIREAVKDQLFWSPFVDEDEVSVQVDGGVVTLTGLVDTLSERDAAVQNAWQGGARNVRNELNVVRRVYGPSDYYYYGYFHPSPS